MTGRGKREPGNASPTRTAQILVHVQPRAQQTEIVGRHGDAIKIRVAAPPVDGAANDGLLRFLARRLDLPRAQLRLTSGTTGRRKRVEVSGLDAATVLHRLGLR